jgi:hypothetical protein
MGIRQACCGDIVREDLAWLFYGWWTLLAEVALQELTISSYLLH